MAGFFLLVLFIQVAQFNCESPEGYLNIDCGLTSDSKLIDSVTGLTYISDNSFIETGEIYSISKSYVPSLTDKKYLNLRSFPNGSRNCYTLPSSEQKDETKYLLRVGFLYGNYDGLSSATKSSPFSFDLYIGVNFWQTVNIFDESEQYQYELITLASDEVMFICLINTGSGTPFISFIERRQLNPKMYPSANSSQSLNSSDRYYMGNSSDLIIRYPDDPYDRIWKPRVEAQWYTRWYKDVKFNPSSDDMFQVPSSVLQHVFANSTNNINGSIHFKLEYPHTNEHYMFLHFSEIWNIPIGSRSSNITINHVSYTTTGPLSVGYRMSKTVFTPDPSASLGFEVLIEATSTSTYRPILSAVEVYSLVKETVVATYEEDFDAIKKIRDNYKVKRSWIGDPCLPKKYTWDGVGCNYTIDMAPTIIFINLSSSGLSGQILNYFSDFESLQTLDLSYNQLNGDVPDSLANVSSLMVLNLAGNCLGRIPYSLQQKSDSGTLTLRFDNKTNGCQSDSHKKKSSIIAIAVIVPIVSVIVVATLIWLYIRKQRQKVTISHPTERESESIVVFGGASQTIRFTKSEVEKMIKTYNRCIGSGGFGEVFYGKLENNIEVAIKVLSRTSSQGYKEFKKEVEALSRVYHANIVTFIGYCEEEEYLALVYEYMPNRSLADQLHEGSSFQSALSWDKKLKIAIGAAQGMEYLHTGHRMVHRDVKSANILLDQNFEAKVSDFGMSRTFNESTVTLTQSAIGGTFGYLDPEVLTGLTKKLSFASDVYSFGVVLLEMLTGQPPYSPERGRVHIVEYVSQNPNVIDPRMGEYDAETLRMVMNLAMQCTQRASKDRPTMPYVVLDLQQCLDVETSSQWSTSKTISTEMPNHNIDKSMFGGF